MLALLAYIGGFCADVWAVLVEFMPFLAKIGPWLASLAPAITGFLGKVLSKFGADTTESILKGGVALAVRLACVVAWGICLAVVTTGIDGLAIRDLCFQNPFSGFPEAMMFLVAAAFPIKFSLALVTSYILFRVTVYQATLIMSRTIKYLFGA